MLSVVTYWWQDPRRRSRGYEFTIDHVRILRNMVDRHLKQEHNFICVTDNVAAVELEGIEAFPLDMTKHVPGTVYARLMQHNPEIGRQLGSRILSLDLDMVIVDNIDSIVNRDEDIVLWRNPNFPAPRRAFYQSSVQLFTPGARPELWADFDPSDDDLLRWINWRFGGAEQAWISERLSWDEAYWDQNDGIYGAGRLGDWSTIGVVKKLPDNAKIVSFPGAREPSQPEVQARHPWIKEHYK